MLINYRLKNYFQESFSRINYSNNKGSLYFVVINILVAFLGFVRSFVFMKYLGFNELGILTLIQTGGMLVGLFQIGLINGGYRILALQKFDLSKQTNNIIFSFFGLIFLVILLFLTAGTLVNIINNPDIVAITILIGLSLLVNNWLMNTLIADRDYKRINIGNSISALASILILPAAYYYGVYGAILSIFIQPLVFIIYVFSVRKSKIPNRFIFKIGKIKEILNYGFIPYLSGLFLLLYIQIERWGIGIILGTSALGHLYLLFLISTLWVLVPTSVNSLLFPRAVLSYESKDKIKFNNIIKTNFYFIICYGIIVSLILFLFLDKIVALIFPIHVSNVTLALCALPGLFLRILGDPIKLFFNSIVVLKPILISDIVALLIYVIIISGLIFNDSFSLFSAVISFNIYFAIKLIILLLFYYRYKNIP